MHWCSNIFFNEAYTVYIVSRIAHINSLKLKLIVVECLRDYSVPFNLQP